MEMSGGNRMKLRQRAPTSLCWLPSRLFCDKIATVMKSPSQIPTTEELRLIPRWARVALTARAVRRLQPLLLASWPDVSEEFQRHIEWAISEAETAAAQGSLTLDLEDAGMAAMEVYSRRPNNVEPAGHLSYAAAHSWRSTAACLRIRSGPRAVGRSLLRARSRGSRS